MCRCLDHEVRTVFPEELREIGTVCQKPTGGTIPPVSDRPS